MSMLTDVRSIAVNVTNQDAALGFYRRALGFDVIFDGDTPAGRWIMISRPDANVTLSLVGNAAGSGVDTGIRFGAADAAAARARLINSDVKVSDLITWDGVPRMFSFDNADRNRFYVIEDRQ